MIFLQGDLWSVAPQFEQRLQRELQQPEPERAAIPTAACFATARNIDLAKTPG